MSFLQRTVVSLIRESRNKQARHIEQHLSHYESREQLHLLKQLLCIRSPQPPLPGDLVNDIDSILTHSQNQRILTRGSSIPVRAALDRPGKPSVQLMLWQGDITALASDVIAITNAANSQMLGCFQPTHKCIDNVIHSFAGPQLRQECFDIMEARGCDLPVGEAVVTKGYCLPSPHIIHIVGPQLDPGADPTNEEIQQLRQCYVSVLEQSDGLPANEDGSKRIALCGISTGLFAFPTSLAAKIAVDTVAAWVAHKEDTSITDVIFVTFAEGDYDIYNNLLPDIKEPWRLQNPHFPPTEMLQVEGNTLTTARQWLKSADTIVISAGAGFSAADGLDYTSKALFKKHFPSFIDMGLDTLYSAIGFEFPSEEAKWAYYFINIQMVRSWPGWDLYQCLVPWLKASGKDVHVRTSNADGLFLTNGWDEGRLSTPQGRYSVLQCLAKCRPDSTFDTLPFYNAALPFLDPKTQRLMEPSRVPTCKNCGGKMMLCVRGGNWFNDRPFQNGEMRWRKFRHDILRDEKETVILELGVGMNTPGVLRWPDEDLVRKGGGRVKLVRVGLGPSAAVPDDLEEDGLAVSIEGNIKLAVPWMLETAPYEPEPLVNNTLHHLRH
ncbi:A1pp-domain-containing protein [Macroventuria anomochaeta]|uniref:A1pp-domain-containing protein n=1 Tax=Macroventuria anomochaeta TaxID=301207 RepID=A0ACB6SHS0_9PLEO|nr:A1pp-domain-containing protein [Macroventuria anomochaeta]KAF2632834.1 A1pp-domain-containing protein [Macroventuria anomochaeta]